MFNPYLRVYSLILEREEGKERNVVCFPYVPDWDRTLNLGMCLDGRSTHNSLVYRMLIQPNEPPIQGYSEMQIST